MNQKLKNLLYKARREGKVNKEIEIAEKLNCYFLAGTIAKEHGLYKKAYENFKRNNQKEDMSMIQDIVNLKKIPAVIDIINNNFYKKVDLKSKYKETLKN